MEPRFVEYPVEIRFESETSPARALEWLLESNQGVVFESGKDKHWFVSHPEGVIYVSSTNPLSLKMGEPVPVDAAVRALEGCSSRPFNPFDSDNTFILEFIVKTRGVSSAELEDIYDRDAFVRVDREKRFDYGFALDNIPREYIRERDGKVTGIVDADRLLKRRENGNMTIPFYNFSNPVSREAVADLLRTDDEVVTIREQVQRLYVKEINI